MPSRFRDMVNISGHNHAKQGADGTWTRQEPVEFYVCIMVIIPQVNPVPKESSINSNSRHLQPMLSRFRDMVDISDHNHIKQGAKGTWTRQEPVEF